MLMKCVYVISFSVFHTEATVIRSLIQRITENVLSTCEEKNDDIFGVVPLWPRL